MQFPLALSILPKRQIKMENYVFKLAQRGATGIRIACGKECDENLDTNAPLQASHPQPLMHTPPFTTGNRFNNWWLYNYLILKCQRKRRFTCSTSVTSIFHFSRIYRYGSATWHKTHVCSTVSTTVLCDPLLM
jgi:hypothetical protein